MLKKLRSTVGMQGHTSASSSTGHSCAHENTTRRQVVDSQQMRHMDLKGSVGMQGHTSLCQRQAAWGTPAHNQRTQAGRQAGRQTVGQQAHASYGLSMDLWQPWAHLSVKQHRALSRTQEQSRQGARQVLGQQAGALQRPALSAV
jgi:hypothetical protein